MIELMLKLLTYEPFEAMTDQNEIAYINDILAGKITEPNTLYDDLFKGFYNYIQAGNFMNIVWLQNWKNKYFPSDTYMSKGGKYQYPVLFKKICVFCIVEGNLSDKAFMRGIGSRVNILNKWNISPQYTKLISRNTYRSLTVNRNGLKREYITKAIKAAYYEASRQVAADNRFANQEDWLAPNKKELLSFVDVFAGTGTVSASVDANTIHINDKEVGVVCFLYSVVHYQADIKARLAELHNNFVTQDITGGANLYTLENWNDKHAKRYPQYQGVSAADTFMVLIRNNYKYMIEMYETACGNGKKANKGKSVTVDFSSPNKTLILDIGVAWFFISSIKANGHYGNKLETTNMDVDNYYDYLENVLGIKYKRGTLGKAYKQSHQVDPTDITFLQGLKLTTQNIKLASDKFIKALQDANVHNEDFRDILNNCGGSEDFEYLDPPYFLTTGYETFFSDQDHKDMLDNLRESPCYWLYSMQYKEDYVQSEEKKDKFFGGIAESPVSPIRQKSRRIRCYLDYYKGFAYRFKESEDEEGYPLYVFDGNDKDGIKRAEKLFVILFNTENNDNKTGEMMIANFDVRRVFPYNNKYDVVVMKYTDFIDNLFVQGVGHATYGSMINKAIDLRKDDIRANFSSGSFI